MKEAAKDVITLGFVFATSAAMILGIVLILSMVKGTAL